MSSGHVDFYRTPGLARVRDQLVSGGVFALWSDDPPDDDFVAVMAGVFDGVSAHIVTFPNFHSGGESACTVYVASS